MSTLTARDVEHVFESLRKGLVPERGVDAFAVGIEKQRGELHRQLDLARDQEGTIKFLRGGYGCGKTFVSRLALIDAQAGGPQRTRPCSRPQAGTPDLPCHRCRCNPGPARNRYCRR